MGEVSAETARVHPDCASRSVVHGPHELASPGGCKSGSPCGGYDRDWGEADLTAIAARATAHNYGQTVWGVNRIGDKRWVLRMSSWPRAQEAARALRAAGYVAEDCGADSLDVRLRPGQATP